MRADTFTDQQVEQLVSTVINQTISLGFFSIFSPIIAKLPILSELSESDSSAFPLVMMTTMITQAFVTIIISFVFDMSEVKRELMRFLNEKGLIFKTQTQACRDYSGPEVPIVSGYAHLIKIVWFGFIYAVVSPICLPIAALALLIFYTTERILFHYRYSISTYGGPKLNQSFLSMFELTPLIIGAFNFLIYTTTDNENNEGNDERIFWIHIANIAIGCLFFIFPSQLLIENFYSKKNQK